MQQELKRFSEFWIKVENKKFVGEKIRLAKVLNTEIIVHGYRIEQSKYPEKGSDFCLHLQISLDNKKYVSFSIAKLLIETIQKIPNSDFPFITKIVNNNDSYEFT